MRNPGSRLTLFSLFGLLVVAPLQEAFGYAIDLFQQSTQERRGAVSGTGDENDVWKLEPGKPQRRELAGGQRHTYKLIGPSHYIYFMLHAIRRRAVAPPL